MWFNLDVCGIMVRLQINKYHPTSDKEGDEWYSHWCEVDYSFTSKSWLNYHKESDEVLLSGEVEMLEKVLTELLRDQLNEVKVFGCIEPDFKFVLHPKRDLRKEGVICAPGLEIADFYLEWKIYFWDDGLTDNHLTLVMDRDEIRAFRDYLSEIIRPKLK